VLCVVTKLNSVDVQKHNERTSTEFNLVTTQSTAHEPTEDGRIYIWTETCRGRFCKVFLSVLCVDVNWCF